MEFVDSKVLENLLIDDFTLDIANEGLVDGIKGLFTKAVNLVKGFFKKIIEIFGKMINFIKSKLKLKENGKLFEKKLKPVEIVDFIGDTEAFASALMQMVNILRKPMTADVNVDQEVELFTQKNEKMEDICGKIITKSRKLEQKYTGDYSIAADNAEKFLNQLSNARSAFETAESKLSKISSQALNMSIRTNNSDYRNMFAMFNRITARVSCVLKSVNSVSTIIMNAHYYYGNGVEVVDQRMATA